MNKKTREAVVSKVATELDGIDLGDPRRNSRALRIGEALAASPRRSFPKTTRSEAELEGLYRLLGNEQVEPDDVLAPHVASTVERARKAKVVLAVHDTTQVVFKGEKRAETLGSVANGASGFFVHATLAVPGEEGRNPLGILGLQTFSRAAKPKHQRRATKTERNAKRRKASKEVRAMKQTAKESDRWRKCALETQALLGHELKCIHVMDRESDSYPFLAAMNEGGLNYVIRAKHDRLLEEGIKLWDSLDEVRGELFRSVVLSKRRFINRKFAHPQRDGREARLKIRWKEVTIPRPQGAQSELEEVTLWAVQVFEDDAPAGEPPIEWTLLTSEQIQSMEDATRVVDWYRKRWLIEEFFKSLKSGCSFEQRELESEHSLLNALAFFAPIAWTLLCLRSTVANNPNADASIMFTADDLKLLRVISRRKMSAAPTLDEAMLAIASLGGHLKHNGDPGWSTLADGYTEFLSAQRGWQAARANL